MAQANACILPTHSTRPFCDVSKRVLARLYPLLTRDEASRSHGGTCEIGR
ncbi:hypothetical protein J3D48_006221 [Pseudomonas fluorescens]|nr:hypothetical protein [Pseudomonas fluorescens]